MLCYISKNFIHLLPTDSHLQLQNPSTIDYEYIRHISHFESLLPLFCTQCISGKSKLHGCLELSISFCLCRASARVWTTWMRMRMMMMTTMMLMLLLLSCRNVQSRCPGKGRNNNNNNDNNHGHVKRSMQID